MPRRWGGRRGVLLPVVLVAVVLTTLVACSSSPASPARRGEPATTEPTLPTEPTRPTSSANPSGCAPSPALVDPEATEEARCLAARLDEWQASGGLGVGQQLNTSGRTFLAPLEELEPHRVAVVGFDLDELADGEAFGIVPSPVRALLEQAAAGRVLTASWHLPNPHTGLSSGDRSWQDLGALLDETTREGRAFWRDVDEKLALLARFQSGDDGAYPPAAVLFRPLHEANGDWFWWGQGADPGAYRALWTALQDRAADAAVHNLVWAFSANARTHDGITDPLALLPDRVDLVGVDSYEQVAAGTPQAATVDLTGLAELAARVPRHAITEVGPHGSTDGAWDPSVIARSAAGLGLRPAYALLWFDDGDGSDGWSGRKQISSLRHGPDWLAGCPDGVCPLG